MTEEEKEEFQEEKSDSEPQHSVSTTNLSNITKQINEAQDLDKIKDLTKLFNVAMLKKEINRAERQSDILDYALEEVWSRIANGDIKDQDLAKYISIFQTSISNTRKATTEESLPIINIEKIDINNNQEETLSRESREKIMKVIEMILTQSDDSDIIEVESNEKESENND